MSEDRDDRDGGSEEAAFKVIDRRRFAADGSERGEEVVEEVVSAGGDSPAAESATSRPRDAGPTARPDAPPAADASEPAPSSHGGPTLGSVEGPPYEGTAAEASHSSFATLILSLSTQVLMALGEIPEEPGAQPSRDLEAARNVIDLLAVLKQKTQGNLEEDEQRLLEGMLYDLRMRFVQLSGSQM